MSLCDRKEPMATCDGRQNQKIGKVESAPVNDVPARFKQRMKWTVSGLNREFDLLGTDKIRIAKSCPRLFCLDRAVRLVSNAFFQLQSAQTILRALFDCE